MNEFSQSNATQIYIVGEKNEGLLQISVKNWLLQSGKNFSITELTFEAFERLSDATVQASDLFLFLRTDETTNELLPSLTTFRSNEKLNPVLVIHFNPISLIQIRDLLRIEGTSIVSSKISGTELLHYLGELSMNTRLLSKDITARIVDHFLSAPAVQLSSLNNAFNKFSMQEQSIIDLAIKGLSIRETAETLGLSPNTIAVYRSKMIKKAGISSFRKLLEQ